MAETVEQVPIDAIHPHPDNPNQGDVGAISESIDAVGGFYNVVFVQRATGRIIAGEHRWRTLHARGAPVAPVIYLDVDDETALRILIADNELPRRTSHADEHRLAALLTDLAQQSERGLAGTGFDGDALDRLLADLNTAIVAPPSSGLGAQGELTRRLTTDVRQVILVLSEADFLDAVRTLTRIIAVYEDVTTNGEAVTMLLREWADAHPAD